MPEYDKIAGLVLYTITNDQIRAAVRSFIEDKLLGKEIDQSTYSLPLKGNCVALHDLRDFLHQKQFVFCPEDYIRVCYAMFLVDGRATNGDRDKIAMYNLINNAQKHENK